MESAGEKEINMDNLIVHMPFCKLNNRLSGHYRRAFKSGIECKYYLINHLKQQPIQKLEIICRQVIMYYRKKSFLMHDFTSVNV